ncbi:phosphatase PAP2 family protein [Demequina activiva]|uniref:Lipid phosphate phosphatase YodM n=1 Tax=Demequina activiva TaxID=1582364 RepID=A0A919Q3Z3_9MICO|nr:phosphatase PAP2 family protein [Demequina activiva]GIG53868.1 putative lipid phosphate phosphatase YodM [Demequina activiva]
MIRDAWMRLPGMVRVLLPGLLVSGLALWAFAEILEEVLEREAFEGIDEPLIAWFAENRSEGVTTAMEWITHAFGPVVLPIIIAIGCGIWGWRTKSWRDPVMVVSAMIFSTVTSMVVKMIVERPRPADELQVIPGFETSFSFPSGHTTGAATLVLVTGYLLWRHERRTRVLVVWFLSSLAIIALVATTRMYLGYHFLSDVIAGACLGLFTLGLVICADRWLDRRATLPSDQAWGDVTEPVDRG